MSIALPAGLPARRTLLAEGVEEVAVFGHGTLGMMEVQAQDPDGGGAGDERQVERIGSFEIIRESAA